MRGQTAVEYLLILSAAVMIFAVVTFTQMINPATESSGDAQLLSQARSAADAIAGAVNSVYGNGRGAVRSVSFTIDRSWSLYLENARGDEKVRISVRTFDRVENVRSGVRYAFDNSLLDLPAGTYTVIAEWLGDGENMVRENYKIYIRIRPRG